MKKLSLCVSMVALFVTAAAYVGSVDRDPYNSAMERVQEYGSGQYLKEGTGVIVIAGNTACNPRVTVCEE